jgi:hypothetical protein
VSDDALRVGAVAPPLEPTRHLLDLARQLLAFGGVEDQRDLGLDEDTVRREVGGRLAVALGRTRYAVAQRGGRVDRISLEEDGGEKEG